MEKGGIISKEHIVLGKVVFLRGTEGGLPEGCLLADPETPGWLVTGHITFRVETAVTLGFKSWFADKDLHTSDLIWDLWFFLLYIKLRVNKFACFSVADLSLSV